MYIFVPADKDSWKRTTLHEYGTLLSTKQKLHLSGKKDYVMVIASY